MRRIRRVSHAGSSLLLSVALTLSGGCSERASKADCPPEDRIPGPSLEAEAEGLIHKAEKGEASAYEMAKAPLLRCIEANPKRARCHHLLGVAYEWTNRPREAAQSYSKAIVLGPRAPDSYAPLAEIYMAFRLDPEAEQVLNEGVRRAEPSAEDRSSLYTMHNLLAKIAVRKGASPVAALERAYQAGREHHPESAFELGKAYLGATPPRIEQAQKLLREFYRRVCRGADPETHKLRCQETNELLHMLGDL
jgi:tetratricopeptide (TPR) repeat protein